jgi:hypothetical protein
MLIRCGSSVGTTSSTGDDIVRADGGKSSVHAQQTGLASPSEGGALPTTPSACSGSTLMTSLG